MSPKIKETLKELGLAASKSRGQNFLQDPNYIRRIVEAMDQVAPTGATIVEIGPGLGALTWPLLATGRPVLAVELDRGLAENLTLQAPNPEHLSRLTILHQDILTVTETELPPNSPALPLLGGNLPYNISSPVLFWFLALRHRFAAAVFMLQKEMARRLVATPGQRDYGRLAAALGLWFKVEYLFTVSPTAFHPRPKVDSAVVALTTATGPTPVVSPKNFSRLTAAAFASPRKTILNNLTRAYGRPRTEKALNSLNIEPGLRPGVLPPSTLAELAIFLETID